MANILALGFVPKKLSSIIVTHRHIDHIGALAESKQAYGVTIIAHKLDAHAIESGEGVGAEFYGVDYRPCHVDTRLEEAEHSLRFGQYELKVLHNSWSYSRQNCCIYRRCEHEGTLQARYT